ncbi:ABC transporter permease [Herbaspirillum rhizosphaerae]|uniref:Transport permease protein n=1 Tax=Herbaspirillum rhizosphaerae TaxID=346179 RepID=A0ABW8Z9Z6_9BURK
MSTNGINPSSITSANSPEIVISANPDHSHYWRDFWSFRELLALLVWRDVLVRYKQTVIGASWAILRPLATMLVFTLVFGKIAKLPSSDTPYALLVFAGLLPWMFFATTLSEAGNSITANGHIVSKVYFPRLIVPVSTLLVGLVDFLLAGLVYLALAVIFGHFPNWHIIFLPLFLILLCGLIMGCGLWVAALNVKYRDFRYIVPVVLQLGAYLSPVGFASSLVPERWRLLYSINPMVGIIDGFRWSLLGDGFPLHWDSLLMSLLVTMLLLIPGIIFFRRSEGAFADAI